MPTTEEIAAINARILEIDSILSSGSSSSTLDGTTVSYDLESLRKEREELRSRLTSDKRRRAFGVRLG
jgi:hypothetical protein